MTHKKSPGTSGIHNPRSSKIQLPAVSLPRDLHPSRGPANGLQLGFIQIVCPKADGLMDQEFVKTGAIPMGIGEDIVGAGGHHEDGLWVGGVEKRLVPLVVIKSKTAFEPHRQIGVFPLPASPFGECHERRQVVPVTQFLQEEVRQWGAGLANGKARMTSTFHEDCPQAQATGDHGQNSPTKAAADDDEIVGVAHPGTIAGDRISAIAQSPLVGERGGVTADRLTLERELLAHGCQRIIGVDEAGRGPLAGSVVAAAAVLPMQWIREGMPAEFEALNDSKQLGASQREAFFERLIATTGFEFGIAQVEAAEIDRINILQATHQAMRHAIRLLGTSTAHALVDGRFVPHLGVPQTALVRGDSRSYSIAAASVLAKVTRDREMLEADRLWPGYGFARHKGYGTADHLAAMARLGPCPLHRRSFAPLRKPEPDLFSS